jgi:hypothetical protein
MEYGGKRENASQEPVDGFGCIDVLVRKNRDKENREVRRIWMLGCLLAGSWSVDEWVRR